MFIFLFYAMKLDKELLEQLIACKKQVDKVEPLQEKSQYNHKQQTIKVSWGWYLFEIFTRRNEDLPTNFSVWLIRKWPEENVYLCRYNWDHWLHRNPNGEIIKWFHKHIYNIEAKEQWLSDDAYAEVSNEYASLEQALMQICKKYNIDYNGKLDGIIPPQWSLFDN